MTTRLEELRKDYHKYVLMLEKQIRTNEWRKPMPRARIICIKQDTLDRIKELEAEMEGAE